MSSNDRPWYQDGCLMSVLAGIALAVFLVWFYASRTNVDLKISGGVQPGIFSGGTFVVKAWHISTGTLKKGRLTVVVSGAPLKDSPVTRYHAFDQWAPNEDQAVAFEFPLLDQPTEGPIDVTITVTAAHAHEARYTVQWSGDGWSTPLTKQ